MMGDYIWNLVREENCYLFTNAMSLAISLNYELWSNR